MNKTVETLQALSSPCLTDVDLSLLLKGSADSRYGKLKRLLAANKLIRIRRGLYCRTDVVDHSIKMHPFELAHHIYASSYISLESALAYHKLIPEAVYTITGVCTKRSKDFNTPLGLFSYSRLPLENFYIEVERITENASHFFMAKPWKAICDYVFCYKKNWTSLDPLLKSMRINVEDLPGISNKELEILDEYYHHMRLSRFIKAIKPELAEFDLLIGV